MEQYIFITFAIFIVFISVYICSVKVLKYLNKKFIYSWVSIGISCVSLWIIGKNFDFYPEKNIKTALFALPFVVISIYCERFFIKKDTIKVNSKPNYSIDYDINRINIAKKACEDYTLEIALDPQNFNFHLERARIYESLKKYDLAVQDLTRAMPLDSQKSYFYYFLRHKQYIFLGDLEKALEDIKKLLT